jgi:nitrous oxidase accessory protein NosD
VRAQNNTWDNGTQGNYWSDYIGADDNRDGIGDSLYTVYENMTDHHPLMEPVMIPDFPDEENQIIPTTEPFPTTLIVASVASVAVAGMGLLQETQTLGSLPFFQQLQSCLTFQYVC